MRTQQNKKKKKTSTIAVPFIVCNGLVDCLGLIWQWKLSFSEWTMAFWVVPLQGWTGKLLLQILKRPISTLIVLWVSYLTYLTTTSDFLGNWKKTLKSQSSQHPSKVVSLWVLVYSNVTASATAVLTMWSAQIFFTSKFSYLLFCKPPRP